MITLEKINPVGLAWMIKNKRLFPLDLQVKLTKCYVENKYASVTDDTMINRQLIKFIDANNEFKSRLRKKVSDRNELHEIFVKVNNVIDFCPSAIYEFRNLIDMSNNIIENDSSDLQIVNDVSYWFWDSLMPFKSLVFDMYLDTKENNVELPLDIYITGKTKDTFRQLIYSLTRDFMLNKSTHPEYIAAKLRNFLKFVGIDNLNDFGRSYFTYLEDLGYRYTSEVKRLVNEMLSSDAFFKITDNLEENMRENASDINEGISFTLKGHKDFNYSKLISSIRYIRENTHDILSIPCDQDVSFSLKMEDSYAIKNATSVTKVMSTSGQMYSVITHNNKDYLLESVGNNIYGIELYKTFEPSIVTIIGIPEIEGIEFKEGNIWQN